MPTIKWLEESLDALLKGKSVPEEQVRQLSDTVRKAYDAELLKPPAIAIIGPTGVGKTSTINALFGSSLHVSHTKAGTHSPSKIQISAKSFKPEQVKGKRGDLLIYDMPGIGEDIEKDREHEETYRRIISQCDVAVWIISAVDRRMAEDQRFIRDILRSANESVVDRLVFGVNKIDVIDPDDWDQYANLPSNEQENNLQERVEDIRSKLLKVCPGLSRERIVPYSAKQHYRLLDLFSAMLYACPDERAWVLASRQKIADYREFVDPEFLKQLQGR